MFHRSQPIRNRCGNDVAAIGLLGDISLHNIHDLDVNCFGHLRSMRDKVDVLIANVETVISDRQLRPFKKNGILLKSPHATASVLKDLGVDIALLANNHIDDFEIDGIGDTIAALHEAGIQTFGLRNREALVFNKNGMSFALFGKTTPIELVNNNLLPTLNVKRDAQAIEGMRKHAKHILYFLHGYDELMSTPWPWRVDRLKRLNNALRPTCLIHGHQHVYQGFILSDGVPICLSYGNALIDIAYHAQNPDTRVGCMAAMYFDEDGCFEINEHFFGTEGGTVSRLKDTEVSETIDRLENIECAFASDQLSRMWREECYAKYSKMFCKERRSPLRNAAAELKWLATNTSILVQCRHYRHMYLAYLQHRLEASHTR